MKKIIALVAAASLAWLPATGAEAAVHHFKNCTDMHRKYKGGVARKGAHDKRASGHARYRPYVSTALYTANKKMDRDHDGIACEQ